MVVKSDLKLIKSLHQKKYRSLHKLFLAEGIKINRLLLKRGFEPYIILAVKADEMGEYAARCTQIPQRELRQISSLKNPGDVLGVYRIPESENVDFKSWVVVLDTISDPGNLGTIIRLCDWYGISHLVCSPTTVDCYNPKVLQATMGSIANVNVLYTDIPKFLAEAPVPVYGGVMDGKPVHSLELPASGILLIGNEANGISKEVAAMMDMGVTIAPVGEPAAESLNAAMATAIFLQEIKRPGRAIQK